MWQVTWKLNGIPLESSEDIRIINNNRSVLIKNAKEEMAGRLTCEAVNKAGNSARDFILRLTGEPALLYQFDRLLYERNISWNLVLI